ncbi:MAG: DUF4860 domain-containing protein [Oscillospiraceae bacterium]
MQYRYKKQLSAYKPVLTFLLFSMFSAALIVTIIFSANVYNKIIENKQDNFNKTVALSYITTKIRSTDQNGSVRVDSIDGNTAIVISEELADETLETWMYTYEGSLCELFAQSNSPKTSDAGIDIIPLSNIDAKIDSGKLSIIVTDIDGKKTKTSVSINSNEI